MKKLTFLLSISICLVACGNDSESSTGPEYVWVDPSTVVHGTMIDSRDGKTYKTVTIGEQTWMAENLNYEYNEGTAKSYCYSNMTSNCDKYGRLYNWSAAMDSAALFSDASKGYGNGMTWNPEGKIRGVCPEGWHLPDRNEWIELVYPMADSVDEREVLGKYFEGTYYGSGRKLKSVDGWIGKGYVWDEYGFSALPGGDYLCSYDEFENIGRGAIFFSSSEYNPYHAYVFGLADHVSARVWQDHKSKAFSVRCLKD